MHISSLKTWFILNCPSLENWYFVSFPFITFSASAFDDSALLLIFKLFVWDCWNDESWTLLAELDVEDDEALVFRNFWRESHVLIWLISIAFNLEICSHNLASIILLFFLSGFGSGLALESLGFFASLETYYYKIYKHSFFSFIR